MHFLTPTMYQHICAPCHHIHFHHISIRFVLLLPFPHALLHLNRAYTCTVTFVRHPIQWPIQNYEISIKK